MDGWMTHLQMIADRVCVTNNVKGLEIFSLGTTLPYYSPQEVWNF